VRRVAVTLALVLAVALPACSDDNGDETVSTDPDTQEPVAPLTGLPDPEGQSATRSALWVKVGNNPDGARPQSGLEQADVVYEELAEGGITRFAAVLNSTVPDQVGPVRSVRAMDPDLVRPLLGIFAYSGGLEGPVSGIRAVSGLLTLNETEAEDAMERSSDRGAPDNLYVIPSVMFGRGGEPKPPRPLFEFLADDEAFEGDAVQSFVVGFEGPFAVTYTWDEAQGVFLRSYGDTPFVDDTGAQIGATNVIVQSIHYPNPSEGVTVGEGDAWVFSQGRLLQGKWERDSAEDVTRFVDAEGNVIKLTPGRTWIALLPNGRPVDVVTPPPPPPPSS